MERDRDTGTEPRRQRGRDLAILCAQLGCLVGLWWLCERAVRALGIPVPGGVVGLAVLLVLLAGFRMPVAWVDRGAGKLLDHLLLFFVPATMSLLNHPEFLGMTGLKVLAVILAGVFSVMAGTALVVEWHCRLRERHAK